MTADPFAEYHYRRDYAWHPGHRKITRKRSYGEPMPVGYPTPITWTAINADGTEEPITGSIWALAKPIKGNRSVWAISDHGDRLPIRVVIVAKTIQAGRSRGRRWDRSGGRMIYPGEVITETDDRSPTGASTAFAKAIRPEQPRAITVTPLPSSVYHLLSTPPK